MSLFDEAVEPAPPAARLHAAHDFVSRCITWSEAEIERRRSAGRPTEEWESYVRFNRHALAELEAGKLDHWFAAPSVQSRDKL